MCIRYLTYIVCDASFLAGNSFRMSFQWTSQPKFIRAPHSHCFACVSVQNAAIGIHGVWMGGSYTPSTSPIPIAAYPHPLLGFLASAALIADMLPEPLLSCVPLPSSGMYGLYPDPPSFLTVGEGVLYFSGCNILSSAFCFFLFMASDLAFFFTPDSAFITFRLLLIV